MVEYCKDGFDGIAPERCPYCGLLPAPEPEDVGEPSPGPGDFRHDPACPIGDIVDEVMDDLERSRGTGPDRYPMPPVPEHIKSIIAKLGPTFSLTAKPPEAGDA